MLHHLRRTILGAAEAAHNELTLLKHKVCRCSIVKVEVSQHIAVVVQHAGPEGSADACTALFTLSRAGCPSSQCQVRSDFTPADRTQTVELLIMGQSLILMTFGFLYLTCYIEGKL